MSKFVKLVAMIALIGGAIAITPGSASARFHNGYRIAGLGHISGIHFGHFNGWFGGPHLRRSHWSGFGLGPAIVLGLGVPYYYADWPGGSHCGWVRTWRWNWGRHYRAWRCW
jgi:hypothetical protein